MTAIKHWMPSIALLAMLALPAAATAAEVIQLADNTGAQKRFMSLDSVRNGTSRVQVISNKNSALKSDRSAMNKGFMLLDRGRGGPIPLQHALLVPAKNSSSNVTSEPQVVRGITPSGTVPPDSEEVISSINADPVLSLFNGNKSAPISSFRDALSGKGSTTPLAAGRHAWPLPADAKQNFTSGYGMRADPFHGKPEFHGGIDIAAPVGTSVLASADGTITKAANDSRYGKFVAIAHADGSESHYGHLSMQTVHEGQQVRRGQVIGAVGSTGRSTGPHLDYRLSQNGQRVDPMSVLSAAGASAVTVAANTNTRPAMRPATKSMMITVR